MYFFFGKILHVQNAASHLWLFCLLNENSSKDEINNNKNIRNTPNNKSGLLQMIMMEKSIRQIWVNVGLRSSKHVSPFTCKGTERPCISAVEPVLHKF